MAIKSDPHIFSGMQRDMSISKHQAQFLYNALNIRLTARNGDTMMSMTNEKGTQIIQGVDSLGGSSVMVGTYLGHCVIDDKLVVFTTGADLSESESFSSTDHIYILYPVDISNNTVRVDELYLGDLGFDTNYPLETLGVYENEHIQKVYWVDGKNSPRVINIYGELNTLTNEYDYKYIRYRRNYDGSNNYIENSDTQFDFIPTLNLNETIEITRTDGTGMFAPGVIQYAFAYYNKYGQESNIFYTSPLKYISFTKRGASPEEKVANTFTITVNNFQSDFDFLRVFSIHRTSINATPTTKRVADIDLSIASGNSVTVVDDGQKGDTIDPTELLYLGGESIIASTMTQKDNTLFLGDLKLVKQAISDDVKTALGSNIVSITTGLNSYTLNTFDDDTGYYSYTPILNDSTPGFKTGEHYRLGVQFQHMNGKWSEPIFIRDYTVPRINTPYIEPSSSRDKSILHIPGINIYPHLSSSIVNELTSSGYRKARPVCVFPTIGDRLVLTQGMLCPTVYNRKGRMSRAPFSQSSWFLRPFVPTTLVGNKAAYNDSGNVPTFLHMAPLGYDTGRDAEIQGAASDKSSMEFFVDQTIITMHSPDIEFDTSFNSLNSTDYGLRIVGAIKFDASIGDIDIQTSTPANNGARGFYRPARATFGSLASSDQAGRSLLTGTFWFDKALSVDSDGKYTPATQETAFAVYPWHRSGSLNNDNVRPSDKGARTAVLEKKKISNLKFSSSNHYFREDHIRNYGVSPVQLFDSDQVTMLKIPYPDSDVSLGEVTYYGNVDTMLSDRVVIRDALDPDPFTGTLRPVTSIDASSGGDTASVRMKYKSTRHLVFSLDAIEHSPVALPVTEEVTNISGAKTANQMFWLDGTNVPDPSSYITIQHQISYPGAEGLEYVLIERGYNPAVDDLLVNTMTHWLYRITEVTRDSTNVITHIGLANYSDTSNKMFICDGQRYRGVSGSLVEEYSGGGSSDLSNNYIVRQDNIVGETINYPYLLLGELYRNPNSDTDFGGNTDEAKRANLWLPAGEPVDITDNMVLKFTDGDTWFQRYDCLKTYPFTLEDENSIVEIGSFLCETRVNIDGRYDKNRGNTSNLVTTPVNFNLLNEVYSQANNFFNYRILDSDYYKLDSFRNSVTWSKEKMAASDVDIWTNITMANTLDMDGSMGKINALRVSNNNIFCFQDTAVSRILFNSRVQIPTSDNLPIEISNSYKVDGKQYISDGMGCTNKWSIVTTPSGLYFIDSISGQLYNITANGTASISGSHGFSNTFSNNRGGVWSPTEWKGPRLFYDNTHNDLYIVYGNSCLVYSELLGQFTSFMSYEKTPAMINIKDSFFALKPVNYYSGTTLTGTSLFLYKMWAGKYNEFFGFMTPGAETVYNPYYKPFNFTFISNQDGALDKIFTNVELRVDFRNNSGEVIHNQFFDYIQAWDEYQDTAMTDISNPRYAASSHFAQAGLKKKFRIWRIDIPRAFDSVGNKRTLQRIRNTWAMLKFGMKPDSAQLRNGVSFELHDLAVQYHT